MTTEVIRNTLMTHYYLGQSGQRLKRLDTFDFARGMAVIFMVLVHVLGLFANSSVYGSLFGTTIDFLGSPPAAPVFMFTMGVFYMLSSKSDTLIVGIKRGIKLFLLGLLLSFLRTDLLNIIAGDITFDFLWEIDILQFAGLAYIFMSLIRHYFTKPIIWFGIATIIMLVSPYLWGIRSGNILVDWLIHYLWGNEDLVYFPLFAWLFYPLFGMIFGVFLKKSQDLDLAFKQLLKPGLLLLIAGSILTLTNLDFHIGDYFRGGQGSMIWILGFVFVWLSLIDKYLSHFIKLNWVQYVIYCGKQTTIIYFVHWLLISWITPIIGYETYGYVATLLLMLMTLIITHLITRIIEVQHLSKTVSSSNQ